MIWNELLYLSPEIFESIINKDSRKLWNLNKYKNDVFTLGLIFLYAGIGWHPTDIYDA